MRPRKRNCEKAVRTTVSLDPVLLATTHPELRKQGFSGLSEYIAFRLRSDFLPQLSGGRFGQAAR